MTLRGADLRFLLPHHVETATVLARPGDVRIDPLRRGLEAAGVCIHLGSPYDRAHDASDLVIAAAQDVGRALQIPARAHILLGRVKPRPLHQNRRWGVPLRTAAPSRGR